MQHITFTRDMKPHKAGEQRLVPDDVAARLVAAGDARDPTPFPARETQVTAATARRRSFVTKA